MRVGILGAGKIATSMADTLNGMSDCELYAIASRDLGKAKAFKEKYKAKVAYGSYEEMLSDPKVDLVYIATPHSHHYEQMKMCIEHMKPVLCEKSFTMNEAQAIEIKYLAAAKGVFVTEAVWPRYMPSRKMIDKVISSGIVGKISQVTCNLSYDIDDKERIAEPALAGGALLDVGIYGLDFLFMHLGTNVKNISSSVLLTDKGVDGMETITITFKSGVMAVATHGIYGRSDRKGIFYGEKGYIVVENINNPRCIDVFNDSDELLSHVDFPKQITGYEYEVEECKRCIEAGKIVSESMPLDDTLFTMGVMDKLRKDWGVKFPGEV